MTKIYFETTGCSANSADSEQMAGLLKQARFEIVNNIEEADILIFNTCTVKGPTETAFYKRLAEVEEQHPYKIIIIAGCIAQMAGKNLKKYPLLGPNQIHHVVEIVEEALNDNIDKMLDQNEIPPLNLPRIRKSPVISIIPIARGCLGHCTFCATKLARGELVSYAPEEIKKEVQDALNDGITEIWLTSQDNGCYGLDRQTNLTKLLEELVNLPGAFKLRIGMINPEHLLKQIDDFLTVMENDKIFKFLHLPVQSGSDVVLKRMGREYTAKDYLRLIHKIKDKFPHATIATDIIAGFPGETDEQHWETLNLLRAVNPDIVNISKFWPRPKTKAAEWKPLPGEVVKHRSKIIRDIAQNIGKICNERWRHWDGYIVIDEKGREEQQWIGRNFAYKPIIVTGDYKLGAIIKTRINRVTSDELWGE